MKLPVNSREVELAWPGHLQDGVRLRLQGSSMPPLRIPFVPETPWHQNQGPMVPTYEVVEFWPTGRRTEDGVEVWAPNP